MRVCGGGEGGEGVLYLDRDGDCHFVELKVLGALPETQVLGVRVPAAGLGPGGKANEHVKETGALPSLKSNQMT